MISVLEKMEEKPLTESINKQYSKYGSLRYKEKEPRFEQCNSEDPKNFLTRIDSSIRDVKEKVKQTIDKSTIVEDYESSIDQQPQSATLQIDNSIPMVKLDRNKPSSSNNLQQLQHNQQQQHHEHEQQQNHDT